MMARRWGSSSRPQLAISGKVRPQPMQRPVWPLTAQVFTQGLEIGAALIGRELKAWRDGWQPWLE